MEYSTIITNIFRTPAIAAALLRNLKKQKAFIRDHIQPDLDEAYRNNDGSLDSGDLKKITDYYGIAIPVIVGELIAALRGFKLSEEERKALTYLGTTTGLFDDFFDKFHLTDEKIRQLIEPSSKFLGSNSAEKLFLHFNKKVLQYVPDKDLLFHYITKVYEAQIESRKQAVPGLSTEEIYRITIEKGGFSVLLCRAAMLNPFLQGEEKALYEIGGLTQFANDLFDIYKDRNDRIHTLATTARDIEEVRRIFQEHVKKSFTAILHTPYKKRNKHKFLRLASLCLSSRCFVVLDQLKSNQESTENIFRAEAYSRKNLICDMEKKINQWRSLKYHFKQEIKIPVDA